MKNKQKKNTYTGTEGFTLLEAVVSLAIIALISGILLFGLSTVRYKAAAKNASNQIVSHLKEAVSRARNDIRPEGCVDGRICSTYFIETHNNTGNYEIYVDNGGTKYNNNYTLSNGSIFSGSDKFKISYNVNTFPIVLIEALAISGSVTGDNSISVSNGGESMNVCIYNGGAVDVRSGLCN